MDRTFRIGWAVELLKEKGHKIGAAFVLADGHHEMNADGVPRRFPEILRSASQYPEWPEREKRHLEYLRGLQRQLAQ